MLAVLLAPCSEADAFVVASLSALPLLPRPRSPSRSRAPSRPDW
ncbi:hypothetical protein [Pseudonocardia sp. GCM10023141]